MSCALALGALPSVYAWAQSTERSTFNAYDDDAMTDEDIIDAFRRGDERAVSALYERYGRLVFTVCLRILGDRSRAEEGVQQTFVQAWRSANSFDPTRELGPWLCTIARRVGIDLLRQDARHRNETLEIHHGSGESEHRRDASLTVLPPNAEQIEAVWRVRQAIDALAPADRELVKMQHFEGLTQNEIAERMAIPVGTVKSRAHRIQRELGRVLRTLGIDGEGVLS